MTSKKNERVPFPFGRVKVLGLTAALGLLLAACSSHSGPKPNAPGVVSAAQTKQDYVAEESVLPPLPPGAAWGQPHVDAKDDAGNAINYQVGIGKQYADFKWECHWIQMVLADKPSSVQYTADLASLAAFQKTFVYTTQSGAREVFDPEYKSAQLGDTSGFGADYQANCTA